MMGEKLKKEVKIRGNKKGNNTYISENSFKILKCLADGIIKPKKLTKKLNLSRKTLWKHKKALIENGYYDEVNGVTNRGNIIIGYSQHNAKWRTNGVEILYELPKDIPTQKWKKYRGRMLALKKVSFDEYNLNRQKIQQIHLRNRHLAKFYNSGVVVYAPDFYGKTIHEVDYKLSIWALDIAEQLRRITGINFMRSNVPLIKFTKYELSRVGDKIAEQARIRKKKVYVRVDGQLRVIFDFSHRFDEREAVTYEYAIKDQQKLESWVEDTITNDSYLSSEVKKILDDNTKKLHLLDELTIDINMKIQELVTQNLNTAKNINNLTEFIKRKIELEEKK